MTSSTPASFRGQQLSRRNFMGAGAALATLATTGSLLTACGSSSSGSSSRSLSYLSNDNDPDSIKWYKGIDADFKKGTGIALSGQTVEPGQDFVTKLQSQIRANQTPTFIPHLDETLAATLYFSGLAKPADTIISQIGKNAFAPSALSHHVTKDGHYHSVPWTVNGMVMWYRTDLLDKAGVSSIDTWDDLLKFAKANTSGNQYGVCLPYGPSTGCTRLFFNFIRNNGGNVVDKDLNVVFDSPQNVETMTFLQELSQYTPPGSATFEWDDMISKFTSKVCAASFYPGRMLGSVADEAPDIADKFAAALVPSPTGSDRFSYVKSEGPVMLTTGSSAKSAEKWIEDYQFGTKWYTDFLRISGGNEFPQVTAMLTAPGFASYALFQAHQPIMDVLRQSVQVGVNYSREAPDFPINSNGGDIDNGTVIIDILQDLLVKKTDPKTVAKNGASKLRDAMKGAKAI